MNFLARICIDRVDWSSLRSSTGTAAYVPDAVERLASAETDSTAQEAYWELDNKVVIQAQLFESAIPLISVLLALLAGPLSPPSRFWIIELLLQIVDGIPHESELVHGAPDLRERSCLEAREGLWLFYGLVFDDNVNARTAGIQLVAAIETNTPRLVGMLDYVFQNDVREDVRLLAADLLGDLRLRLEG
ncbi:MAG: hypothetical protein IT305_12865 [Chloroflexi bacterium]|nr:hypothetical protein [Chloroflexota bacterium]